MKFHKILIVCHFEGGTTKKSPSFKVGDLSHAFEMTEKLI